MVTSPTATKTTQQRLFAKVLLLSSSSSSSNDGDDYDDWYADFDPSVYEPYNNNNNNNDDSFASSSYDGRGGYGRRGGGGGGGYGRSRDGGRRRQGNGGHDYTRDLDADNSNVDTATIDSLIAERLQYRKTGRFDEADAIRDELLNAHGVMICDKDRTWRTGCSASGSGSKWMSGGTMKGPRQGGGREQRQQRRPRDFGPYGHDYSLSREAGPNTSSLDDEEIHNLIRERMECKFNRDYFTADTIQQQLLDAGVVVHDGFKEWRADGKSFEDSARIKYRLVGRVPPGENLSEIEALVEERARCKKERLYNKADAIRDDLMDNFGVFIDDKAREWKFNNAANRGRTGNGPSFPREFVPFSIHPESETPEDHDAIQDMVEQRDVARSNRDYHTADEILDNLMAKGIVVDDKQRCWSVGRIDDQSRPFTVIFQRRGDIGDLTPEDEEKITSMLQKRDEHKRNRKFKSADRIRDQLIETYNVKVDDRAKEWHVVTTEYSFDAESSAPIDEETRDYIADQLAQRAAAKIRKDYETADGIRNHLALNYRVSIDDRVKEWIVTEAIESVENYHEDDEDDEEEDDDEEDLYLEMEEGDEDDVTEDDDLDEEFENDVDDFYLTGDEGDEESADNDFVDSMENIDDDEVSENEETSEISAAEDLNQLTVIQLKDRLRAASLPVSGKKAELIERLSSGL